MQLTAILRHTAPPTKYTITNVFVCNPYYIFPPSRPHSWSPFHTKRRLTTLSHYLLQSMHAGTFSDISVHHTAFILPIYFIPIKYMCVSWWHSAVHNCPDDILQYTTVLMTFCSTQLSWWHSAVHNCPDDILQYTTVLMTFCSTQLSGWHSAVQNCPDDILQYITLSLKMIDNAETRTEGRIINLYIKVCPVGCTVWQNLIQV